MANYFVGGDMEDIVRDMGTIFSSIFCALLLASTQLTRKKATSTTTRTSTTARGVSTRSKNKSNDANGGAPVAAAMKTSTPTLWLPPLGSSKRSAEVLCIKLSVVWIAATIVVIYKQYYEIWGQWGYLIYCGRLVVFHS